MTETCRLVSWNVNGLRAVAKKGFLDYIAADQPDMLCLQEIKATEDQLSSAIRHPKGYFSYFVPAERRGYSGVALYSKEEPISIERGLGIPRFDAEGRTIIAEYPGFTLFNIYFPNGKASSERLEYKMAFYESCLEVMTTYVREGKQVVLCGDVNTAHQPVDLARPKENEAISGFLPEERAWIDRMIESGFVDTFRHFHPEPDRYSWWSYRSGARERNVGWRIDYFYVSAGLLPQVQGADILDGIQGSDHCPIELELAR